MAHSEYIEELISTAIDTTREDGTHTLVLTRDEAEAKVMLDCADQQLGRARYCGRQLLVNSAALFAISVGDYGMLWFIEAAGADPDAMDECLSASDKDMEYVWWPDRTLSFERVLFSDWLREYPNSNWRPVTLRGDLCLKPKFTPPTEDVRTAWQVLMETE